MYDPNSLLLVPFAGIVAALVFGVLRRRGFFRTLLAAALSAFASLVFIALAYAAIFTFVAFYPPSDAAADAAYTPVAEGSLWIAAIAGAIIGLWLSGAFRSSNWRA